MFCYNCGTKLADDALFCHECGTKMITESDTRSIASETLVENKVEEPVNEISEETPAKTYTDISVSETPFENKESQAEVSETQAKQETKSSGNKSKKVPVALIVVPIVIAFVITAVIIVVGIIGITGLIKNESSLFEIAGEVAPLEEKGYSHTYDEVIEWIIPGYKILCEQDGDVAYLNYSGKVSGGDYPVTIVLKMSGVSGDSDIYRIQPYSMTLNEHEMPIEYDGLLSDIFWAYENKEDYPTFMDFVEWDNEYGFGTFAECFKENNNVTIENSSVKNEPTSSIQNKLFREEMLFETDIASFGEYQSTLTLYTDGQFWLCVNLYSGMGNVYGKYSYYGDGNIIDFSVYEKDFSGFEGDDVSNFSMKISDDKLIYSSSDFIGYVSEGMEFLLCDNRSVSQNQSQTEAVVTEQGIYPEYIYLLNEFYNHTTYGSSNSEYTMFLPYVESNEMGYTIMDVDGNGISELIIFWNTEDYSGKICSMFTLSSSGEIIPIIDSTGSRGNISYELCENNNQYYIKYTWFEKTSPNGGYEYFRIDMDEEYLFDSVCSFGFDNSGESIRWYNMTTYETIPESEITRLINSYKTVFIDFDIFSEYEPIG